MTAHLCGDCQLMPANRCTHLLGRRAATPTTPAEGCSYFHDRTAPLVAQARVCPTCRNAAWYIIAGRQYCQKCGYGGPVE